MFQATATYFGYLPDHGKKISFFKDLTYLSCRVRRNQVSTHQESLSSLDIFMFLERSVDTDGAEKSSKVLINCEH